MTVHPEDRSLLGFEWRGTTYVDGMLPFGLRSAPKLFTAVADALEWVFWNRGIYEVARYLDDYITIGPPESPVCGQRLATICQTCADLGVPLAIDKLESPSTQLTFLGIEIDTVAGVVWLPGDKQACLRQLVQQWSGRRVPARGESWSL